MSDKFYVFMNLKNTKLHALTHDRAGANLPQDQGRWQYSKEFEGGLAGRIAFGLEDEAAASAAIAQQGYYLWEWPRLLKAAP